MTTAGFQRLLRFGMVGVLGAAIHMGAFEMLFRLTPIGASGSWLLSFGVAASAGWAFNRRFTFRETPETATGAQWLRYLAVAGLGALAHFMVFVAAMRWVPVLATWPALAIIPGSLASLCVTYAGSVLFVFPSARNRP